MLAWQVMQPQRWIEGLWRLGAALEAQLGCLVGINAYLTPPGEAHQPASSFVDVRNLQNWMRYRCSLVGSGHTISPDKRLPGVTVRSAATCTTVSRDPEDGISMHPSHHAGLTFAHTSPHHLTIC